jgi:methylenetetrahydrofolate dehydrogenase (NADP+)/methenyltetrahydrofolate cyclohydrolase
MTLLENYNVPIEGKHVVIIGRSDIVGKPLAQMMLNKNATVTICHSKTENLETITKTADILISAIGKPKFINETHIKDNVTIVDVGINRTENGLCGDVDFENVKDKCYAITPVPGGVGPMTVYSLIENTMQICH